MATNNSALAVFNNLEKFIGCDDLNPWLQKFHRCCVISGKTEENIKGQLIMLCLGGQALAVAEQLEQELEGAQTYTQVKDRLKNVFDTAANREMKMSQFETRVQSATESVDEFMLALVQLFNSANPDAANADLNKAVKRKFMQGIPYKLRRAIYVFVNDPFAATVTHQTLLEHARKAKINIVDNGDDSDGRAVNSLALSSDFF